MLATDRLEHIDFLLNGMQNPAEILDGVRQLRSAEELQNYLWHYNWSSGFEIPALIADHPECDRGVAMTLFWLSDAPHFYANQGGARSWRDFCKMLTDRLLNAYYQTRQTSLTPPVTRVQLLKLEKAGVPPALLEPVIGELPSPRDQ